MRWHIDGNIYLNSQVKAVDHVMRPGTSLNQVGHAFNEKKCASLFLLVPVIFCVASFFLVPPTGVPL